MNVVATAGHVDHGKSRLVQALTGIDPDRLEEEKRRGLTIDLGFAWLPLPSGREVGIVDVPGHERFIKNMLAGVGAVGATLFVVAANEGWKPQSQEHLDILDLLGVDAAVVAVTKIDQVDEATLSSVVADVGRRISSTTLGGAPVIPVSAVTGAGLEDLVAEIERRLESAPPPEDRGRPRLWVDRVFTIRGSGTVVTGTLVDGSLAQHQEVEILPGGSRARIRDIQSHQKRVERIGPGTRTALNLSGADPEGLRRGDVVSLPGLWLASTRILAEARFLPHLGHEPTDKGAFKLYSGSAEREASLRFLEPQPEPGGTTLVSIALREPVVLDWHDRFVLRDAGRRETLGGGVVLEAHPATIPAVRRGLYDAARRRALASTRDEYLQVLVDEEGSLPAAAVTPRVGIDPDMAGVDGVRLPSALFSRDRFRALEESLLEAVERHQAERPLEPGLPREAARAGLRLDQRIFDEVIEELGNRGSLVPDTTYLRTPGHSPSLGPEREALMSEIENAGPSPPTVAELEKRYDPALIRAMVRAGDLVAVSPAIVYPAGWIEDLKRRVAGRVGESGPFTVAAFRDLVGTTRKYAVPLLEYLDQIGFTRRSGDERVLGPKAG